MLQLNEKQKKARGQLISDYTDNGRSPHKVKQMIQWMEDPVKLRIINALCASN